MTASTDFTRPSRSELVARDRDDLNARIPLADSNLRRTLLGGVATMHAGGLDGAYGYLAYIADQVFPGTADSAHLGRWSSFWGIFPKDATGSAGPAAGTGTDGIVVLAGTVLQSGAGLDYSTTADATVAGGVIAIDVTSDTAGAATALDPGVQLNLVSPIPGVSSLFVVGAPGVLGGTDAETDPELFSRLEARIQTPPSGGGPGDYEGWARRLPGVTRAWEFPLIAGLGTVGLAFVYDDRPDIFPLAGDVTAMQAWLESLAPLTAAVTAFAPLDLTVDFTIHLSPDTADIRAAVTAELGDLFMREAEPGNDVLRSHYDQAIGLAVGAGDYTVTAPAGDVVAAANELATLGAITWV
ncbi:MAG: baseplate J/gp47 family protein [Caulobacteraceae bacterium]